MTTLRDKLIQFELINSDYPIDPAEHLQAAYDIEERLSQMGAEEIYEKALLMIVEKARGGKATPFDVYHASARQRCEAAVGVMETVEFVEKHKSGGGDE